VLTLFALIGVRVLPSLEAVPTADPPSHRHTAVHPARLIVTSQRGGENEPLPIGVSLQHGSGGETVIITGLDGGTELSLGSSLGPTAWLISAADLEQAFIAAPPSFLGVMRATANLRSSRDELLDSKVVSYEWAKINLREGRMTPAVDVPERSVPVVVALAPETLALLLKRAESLLQQGEVSAARVLLRRAAPHSGQAALELGMTFDQSLLTQWGVVGVEADEAEARRWYELAINLGSDEAVYHRRQLAGEPTDRDPSEAKPRAQP
jgi:hypothetical protein